MNQEKKIGGWELVLFLAGMATVLVSFTFLFNDLWWNGFVEYDSFTNSTVGFHVSEGRSLYRTIWGSKPPGIYFLDAAFISAFGPHQTSIWLAQMSSGIVLLSAMYILLYMITRRMVISWAGTLLFMMMFFFGTIYQGGNLTEEYGAACIILGWVGLAYWYFYKRNIGLWLGGFVMCMALWFKEPFLFSVTAPGIWLIIYSVRERNAGLVLRFLGGAMILNVAFALYFWSSGTWFDYLKYLSYTTDYAGYSGVTFWEKVANTFQYLGDYMDSSLYGWKYSILIVIPAIFLAKRNQRTFLLVFLFSFLLEILAISMSGYTFHHYFYQILPSFYVLVFISLSVFANRLIEKFNTNAMVWGIRFVIYGLTIFASWWHIRNAQKMELPPFRDSKLEVVDLIREKTGRDATIYVEDPMFSQIYLESERISSAFIPVGVYHFFMVEDRYSHERIERFVYSLKDSPPDLIVTSETEGMLSKHPQLVEWFPSHYRSVFTEDTDQGEKITLWERVDDH